MPNLINFMSFIISALLRLPPHSLPPPSPSLPGCCIGDQPRDRGTARQLPADSAHQKVQVRPLLFLLLSVPSPLQTTTRGTKRNSMEMPNQAKDSQGTRQTWQQTSNGEKGNSFISKCKSHGESADKLTHVYACLK